MHKKTDFSAFAQCCKQMREALYIGPFQFAEIIQLNPERLMRFEEKGNVYGAKRIAKDYVAGLLSYSTMNTKTTETPFFELWKTMLKTWLHILG